MPRLAPRAPRAEPAARDVDEAHPLFPPRARHDAETPQPGVRNRQDSARVGCEVTDKLRVGIISANWGAYAHLPAWRTLPDVEVAAICTAHEETARAAAAQHGIAKPYWDYRRMFEDRDLDLIDIGTRPSLRNDMVCAALMAGKHVYNCIPFATGVEPA